MPGKSKDLVLRRKQEREKWRKWREFGDLVRGKRQDKDLGLRELARRVDMSPTYLSKVEHGEFPPPAEKKVKSIAQELGLNADSLLGLAGKIPKDVKAIILRHPEAWADFLRKAQALGKNETTQLAQRLPGAKGKPEQTKLFKGSRGG